MALRRICSQAYSQPSSRFKEEATATLLNGHNSESCVFRGYGFMSGHTQMPQNEARRGDRY
ncbi:hypothetical protein D1345_17440 [Chromobacterium rhizoryzae]|uniref:Uncharacterized protein n=1 Tax=Chromobacterium rhizoryzae TaxID=1778675 RepID=A0AAD0W905_9NEIS|nr:hypothetical protein D1345_17440 [Chromobacterium rhizoryzae]